MAVIAGASLLLAPAARPDPVTTLAPTLVVPANGHEALLVQSLDVAAPGGQVAPAATPMPATPDAAASTAELQPKGDTFGLKATLYITTDRDSGKDSIGCAVVPWRTVAVDGRHVRRHSVLFIKETVGLKMPDGSIHDGYWYATDVGSAITNGRIDLYMGKGVKSIQPLIHLNLKTLTVTRVGTFDGCPGRDGATVATADHETLTPPSMARRPAPVRVTVASTQ